MPDETNIVTKVVVISLESAKERRARFSSRALDAGMDWQYLPAYTQLHPALSYIESDAIAFKGRPLRQGELGCYSSHYAAWESLIEGEADQYIVMEDDIIVDWAFVRKISKVDLDALGIGYLRLYCQLPVNNAAFMRAFIDQSRSIVELFGFASGTQAYVVTKATARKLMAHCKNVRAPIDNELDRSWSHGIPNLTVFPFPVMEESVPSGIGVDRYEKISVPTFVRARIFLNRKRTRWQIRGLRLSHAVKRLLGCAPAVNYLNLQSQKLAYTNKNK
ncbi:glycosyltransferase family 25 protein [Dongia sp.]|uniref:glycosyltransferase family 25 protein n=1 Tax=Dongia sp. TaxID=1977262 RepID=UPI0035B0BF37